MQKVRLIVKFLKKKKLSFGKFKGLSLITGMIFIPGSVIFSVICIGCLYIRKRWFV
ncbi:MAG: hypothetical protein KKF50_05335 [Nanoarchaeota archaeon]|nr:hypothetical protein [Nanoarchaeota archaeon]